MELASAGEEESKDLENTFKIASEIVKLNEKESDLNENVSDKSSESKLPPIVVKTRLEQCYEIKLPVIEVKNRNKMRDKLKK